MKRISTIVAATVIIAVLSLAGCKRGVSKNGSDSASDTTAAVIENVSDGESQPAKPTNNANQENMDTITTAPSTSEAIVEEPVLEILTSMGAIKVKLYKETPLHRDNFVKLARNGYFNGILFHRVINGFMIQAGDPLTRDTTKMDLWGNGGPNYTIPAEFVDTLKHKKGAIAAARRGDSVNPQKESSGSQFYIVQSETGCAHLDGSYTVFGETIDGFSVIDNIAGVETNIKDRPLYPISIISIKEVK